MIDNQRQRGIWNDSNTNQWKHNDNPCDEPPSPWTEKSGGSQESPTFIPFRVGSFRALRHWEYGRRKEK